MFIMYTEIVYLRFFLEKKMRLRKIEGTQPHTTTCTLCVYSCGRRKRLQSDFAMNAFNLN